MSSKKTANLGLHVWEPTDTFLRTEFNENTTMIDAEIKANEGRVAALGTALRGEMASGLAALNTELSGAIQTNSAGITATLGEMRWVKLLDRTLTASTTHWPIDVSGIDFYPYMEIRIHVVSPATNSIYLRVNGLTEKVYGYAEPGYVGSLEERLVAYEDLTKYVYRVSLLGPAPEKRIFVELERGKTDTNGQILLRGCSAPVKWADLATLDLMTPSGNTTVPAGTRVVLMGVRI